MSNMYGRQVVLPLANKSGGGVIAGDVVVIDTANDGAFTTTTTGQSQKSVGIAQETIASNTTGRVLVTGYAALVNVPASITRGHYVETYTVVKQATGNSARRAGSFGQFLTGGTTPTAWLWGFPDNAGAAGSTVAADTIWDAAGDLAVGSGADTAAKLTIGAAGGAVSRINGAVAWNSGTSFPSAATGDRYWRTDLGLEAYYDGTRWLTTQLFSVSFPPTQFLNTSGTGAVNVGRLPVPYKGTYSVWGDSFDWFLTAAGTYSGSVYWSLIMNWADVNDSDTQWGSTALDTKTDTAGSSHNYSHHGSIGAVLNASASEIKARMDPTGSPAQLTYTTIVLHYRLILT